METKTLLTIVALLLAGFITIMVARGDEGKDENVFSDTSEMWRENNMVRESATSSNNDRPVSYRRYDNFRPQGAANSL